jgi:hypothetical protein
MPQNESTKRHANPILVTTGVRSKIANGNNDLRNLFVRYRIENPMKFQMIFQFPESFFPTHEDLLAFEQKLLDSLPSTCEVDGYDTGSGTTNSRRLLGFDRNSETVPVIYSVNKWM